MKTFAVIIGWKRVELLCLAVRKKRIWLWQVYIVLTSLLSCGSCNTVHIGNRATHEQWRTKPGGGRTWDCAGAWEGGRCERHRVKLEWLRMVSRFSCLVSHIKLAYWYMDLWYKVCGRNKQGEKHRCEGSDIEVGAGVEVWRESTSHACCITLKGRRRNFLWC